MVALYPGEGNVSGWLEFFAEQVLKTRTQTNSVSSPCSVEEAADVWKRRGEEGRLEAERVWINRRREGRNELVQVAGANVQELCRRDGAIVIQPIRIRVACRGRRWGKVLRETIRRGRTRLRVRKVEADPVLFVEIVVDFETWNRGVSEVRVSRNRVVVDQIIVCRGWKQGLDL